MFLRHRGAIALCAAPVFFLIAGCGSSNSTAVMTSVSVTATPTQTAVGTSVTISAAVSGSATAPPTGSVSFYAGTSLLGQAALAGSSASIKLATSGYAPGAYQITANYSGDSKNPSASGSTMLDLTGISTSFAVSPNGAAISATGSQQFTVTPSTTQSLTWFVNGVQGGNSSAGTIDSNGVYTPPAGTATAATVQISATESGNPYASSANVPLYYIPAGTVTTTRNGQVAAYAISLPASAQMSVEFGPDTTYGRSTWQQPSTSDGATVTMQVAGMAAPATYHMRADVSLPNNITYTDADQTFTTSPAVSAANVPVVTVTSPGTPTPGIEFMSTYYGFAYDLNGSLIYAQGAPQEAGAGSALGEVSLLSNGHLLAIVTLANGGSAIYEMLLDGTPVRSMTIGQLNSNLVAASYKDGTGVTPTLLKFHHDVIENPTTGHWLVMTQTQRTYQSVEGESGPQTAIGDVVLDVDPGNNFAVDWVWNEFDHLDINRHPYQWPDWTHSNAIVYVAGDHNILVSSRHQSWVMKVNYQDAAGDGSLIWRFGYQGDFTLQSGTDPTDWQYAQHSPAFTTSATTGTFGLTMMDNGDDRQFPSGVTCFVSGGGTPPCFYSRAPYFTVDENAMTATLNEAVPFEKYSYWGGSANLDSAGRPHADFCSVVQPDGSSAAVVQEYTAGDNPQLVWSLTTQDTFTIYRSFRIGSLYPGVTWNSASWQDAAAKAK